MRTSMKTPLTALTLLLAGCELEERHQPEGQLYVTPKHSITYYGTVQDALGIDQAADLWLEWCSIRLIDPGATVTACVVNVRAGATVDGVHAAWWYGDGWIDVAREAPYSSDRYFGLDQYGLLWLRHEWLHELYQDGSHSQFPNQ